MNTIISPLFHALVEHFKAASVSILMEPSRRWRRGRGRRRHYRILRIAVLQQALLHIQIQLLRLTREHLRELQQIQEQHQLQILARHLLALLRSRRIAARGFALRKHRLPFREQRSHLRHQRRTEAGHMRRHAILQRLDVRLEPIIRGRAENRAPLRETLRQLRRIRPILRHHRAMHHRDVFEQRFAKGILHLLARLADGLLRQVIRHTILHQRERTCRRRNPRRQLPARIIGNHPRQMVTAKAEQFPDTDLRVIEGILEEAV